MKLNLTAPINDPTGYGEFSRHVAAGLIAVGADVKIRPLTFDSKRPYGIGAEFEPNLGTHLKPDVCLICMIPPKFKELRDPKVKTVGFSMFEADRLPAGWAEACKTVDKVLVPSQHSFDCFLRSGVENVRWVAPPLKLPEIQTSERPPGPYRFYSCFQWGERKNPIGLLRAYWAEFSGNDDVALNLKLYLKDQDQNELQKIQAEIRTLKSQTRLRHYPPVNLETRHMSEAEVLDFHRANDCYVSASRGEGLGLGAIAAMALGKLCILSETSGHLDFVKVDCGPERLTCRTVRCSKSPTMSVGSYAPFYEGTNWWSEPDLGHLATQMRLAYQHRENRSGTYPDPIAVGKVGAAMAGERFDFKQNSSDLMLALKNVVEGR